MQDREDAMTPLIEVLYFAHCPNVDATLDRVRSAVEEVGLVGVNEVREVAVDSDATALAVRFLGSPTVRVDGVDVEPGAESRRDYGLQCRVYRDGERLEGAVPLSRIVAALRGQPKAAASVPSTEGCCVRKD